MTDTPRLLLVHHLKRLKLPTVLREYDKIARQCASEGVDYERPPQCLPSTARQYTVELSCFCIEGRILTNG